MHRRRFIEVTAAGMLATGLTACGPRAMNSRAGIQKPLDILAFREERRYAYTRFGSIAYNERGSGGTALFLHGFPLNSFQWRGALERLSQFRRCIAPDFMALGYTKVALYQDVGPQAQVEMLVAFLEELSIQEVDLIGNDSGGAVAQLFAVQYPKRVRTLLLTNCDTEQNSPPPGLLPVIELSKQGKFVDQWLAPWLADKNLARSAEGIGGMCYADPKHPTDEAIEYYFSPLIASPERKALVHAYAIALERNPLIGVAEKLRGSAIPARIIWGMGDTIFSPESPDYLDRTVGNSRGVRRLVGRKLFWPEELPDVVAEEASRLWNEF